MGFFPPILAETDWGKLIGAAVAVIFVIVAQVAGAIAKKKEEAERRARAQRAGGGPPPLPQSPRTAGQAERQRQQGYAQKQQDMRAEAEQRRRAVEAAVLANNQRVEREQQTAANEMPAEPAKRARKPRKPKNVPPPQPTYAQAIAGPGTLAQNPDVAGLEGLASTEKNDIAVRVKALLTPQNLRQQYILTEVLGPPAALRPDRVW